MTSENESPLLKLLDRARGGDDDARNKLFQECRSYVNVVARAQMESWLRTKVDASDLVQQTLLDAHHGLDNFRGRTEAEWLGWLRQILTHNATDFIRQYKGAAKRAVRREVPLQQTVPGQSHAYSRDPSDPGESPSQHVLRRERELAVAEAVAQLPEDYREVVLLRNLQRLSFNEVAERMDRTRQAVQMLWLRALRKLEQIITRDGD